MKKSDSIKFLPKKDLFRVDEVADFLSVHIRTVQRWIDEGKIEDVVRLPGRGIRVSRATIMQIVDQSTIST